MRVLFVHEVNYLTKVIFEMHEFPELMALRGHDVSFFHYPEHPSERRVSLRARRERIHGRVHPRAELTLITPPTFGGSAIERYVAPIIDAPALHREIATGGYDVIVLYAVPTTGWQTIAFARRHGVPVIFRALDVSHQIRRTPVSRLIQAAERAVYRGATVLSANNPAMAQYCVDASGRTGPTSVDVPPVDLTHFAAADESDLRPELGLSPEDEVVLYMGSFFEFSGLDIVVRALARLRTERPRLRLVLVGGGELEPELRRLVAEHELGDRVVFTGYVPYDALPRYLKVADVALNPFRPELVTHVALPHKVLQYMAAGVPVVSTDLRGLRGVIGDESGVHFVDGPDEVLSGAIDLLDRTADERAAIAARQRSTALTTFSERAAADGFERLLGSVG